MLMPIYSIVQINDITASYLFRQAQCERYGRQERKGKKLFHNSGERFSQIYRGKKDLFVPFRKAVCFCGNRDENHCSLLVFNWRKLDFSIFREYASRRDNWHVANFSPTGHLHFIQVVPCRAISILRLIIVNRLN
jgi:hypothetical protein